MQDVPERKVGLFPVQWTKIGKFKVSFLGGEGGNPTYMCIQKKPIVSDFDARRKTKKTQEFFFCQRPDQHS